MSYATRTYSHHVFFEKKMKDEQIKKNKQGEEKREQQIPSGKLT